MWRFLRGFMLLVACLCALGLTLFVALVTYSIFFKPAPVPEQPKHPGMVCKVPGDKFIAPDYVCEEYERRANQR